MPKVTLKDENYETLALANLPEEGLYIVVTLKERKNLDAALVLKVTPAPEWEPHNLDVELVQYDVTTKVTLL